MDQLSLSSDKKPKVKLQTNGRSKQARAVKTDVRQESVKCKKLSYTGKLIKRSVSCVI